MGPLCLGACNRLPKARPEEKYQFFRFLSTWGKVFGVASRRKAYNHVLFGTTKVSISVGFSADWRDNSGWKKVNTSVTSKRVSHEGGEWFVEAVPQVQVRSGASVTYTWKTRYSRSTMNGKDEPLETLADRLSKSRVSEHDSKVVRAAENRWEFLKRLQHRLVRDLGFLIASPPLLLDSEELPTVSAGMLGGDDGHWLEVSHWLESLDGDSVESWFKSHPAKNRLGDHFALCVEYVLRFWPTIQTHRLVVSQQVSELLPADGEQLSESNSDFDRANGLPSSNSVSGSHFELKNECTFSSRGVSWGQDFENAGKRKKQMLRRLQRVAVYGAGIPRTIGEFDFLFEVKGRQEAVKEDSGQVNSSPEVEENRLCDATSTGGSRSKHIQKVSRSSEQAIQHWEVSVKFLLYTGPWEAFGLKTPQFASWTKIKLFQQVDDMVEEDRKFVESNADTEDQDDDQNEDHEDADVFFTSQGGNLVDELHASTDDSKILRNNLMHLGDTDNFFGCFLGPHVGESLVQKKNRLRHQLALSAHAEAVTLLNELFPQEQIEDTPVAGFTEAKVPTKPGNRLKVVPRALLKGYLFYEYGLWSVLQKRQSLSQKHRVTGACAVEDGQDGDHSEHSFTVATLNGMHWMGWWCRISDFIHLPFKNDSRWYIVPKLEWLSPVVIEGIDDERCRRVLDVPGLHEAAENLAAEARAQNMPRKTRVMIAEVRWECIGHWVEVSRGFIVEKTWPNSELYKPHGLNLSWSPTLIPR